ncbi:MAG: hypothetical protein ABIB61_00060 [Candidatus Shapirobacteria bacterium]
MKCERPEKNSSPQPEEEFQAQHLSSRKKRSARIEDFTLPVDEISFTDPIPVQEASSQTEEVLAMMAPYLPRELLWWAPEPERGLRFDCRAVVVSGPSGNPRLTIQKETRSAIAREVLDVSVSRALLDRIRAEVSTDVYQELVSNPEPTKPELKVLSGWVGWLTIGRLEQANETFDVLSHLLDQSASGEVRIEMHEVNTVYEEGDVWREGTEKLAPYVFSLKPTSLEFLGKKAIEVNAVLPWFDSKSADDGLTSTTFFVTEDGVHVTQEETNALLQRAREERKQLWMHHIDNKRPELLPTFWSNLSTTLTRREGETRVFGAHVQTGEYRLKAFGQELSVNHSGYGKEFTSIRVFDANYDQPTVRSEDKVRADIYMTSEEADEYETWEEETIQRFVDEIIPSTKELTPEQALIYAAEVVTNSREPLRLLKDRFSTGTRLSIIGMVQHPLQDRLPLEVIERSKDLGIDFIAVHVRNPNDPTRVYKEDREGLVAIKVKGVGMVEMSHEEAQRKHPEQYRSLFKENREWDGVIATARERGVGVMYVEAGDSWTEANQEVVNIISAHLEEHPDSKGVYFSPLLSSIYWPGGSREEHREIGARPFVDVYSLANAHLSDTSIQMAAYGLREKFPGQVHSMPQFVMPRGFGKEWGHFRQVVNATGIPDRFALDNISGTPFATHRYLFNSFPEFRLEELSDQEIAEFLVCTHGYGGWMGVVEIKWGKLIDGVIVYPSDTPLPKSPTPQEFMEAASDYIAGNIEEEFGN